MPILKYVGGGDVVLLRLDGTQVLMRDGDEINLTEDEVRGCACKPERSTDGIWERVITNNEARPTGMQPAKGE